MSRPLTVDEVAAWYAAHVPAAQLGAQAAVARARLEARAQEADRARYDWPRNARPNQLAPPGDWDTWLIQTGRGWGKTRTGAEWVRSEVERLGAIWIALVGRTAADVRDTMIEGPSGLLSVFPPDQRPLYEPSKRRVTFRNGAIATAFCGEEPDQLRGPNHHLAWTDEVASWKRPETWDMLQFGLRLGDHPRTCATTTPRPTKLIKALVADPRTVVTRGSTYENRDNLAAPFLAAVEAKYAGTRLGRQELDGQILEDTEGALWTLAQIDALRVKVAPALIRIVVAVDPAGTKKKRSDETGIVAAGIARVGGALHGFVLDDASLKGSPHEWAGRAIAQYRAHEADLIVGEVNYGGDMVESTVHTVDPRVPFKAVHASRGKAVRAEPVAALYEQGRVHHVGCLAKLEDEMTGWSPAEDSESPNRMDALVWALTELMVGAAAPVKVHVPHDDPAEGWDGQM